MFLHRVPQPPLFPHVGLLWYFESYAPATPRERLLPTGTVELVFDLSGPSRIFRDDSDHHGETFRGGLLCGPQSRYFVLDTSAPQTVVGVHFSPSGAAAFFRQPLSEMRDRHVALADLWTPAEAALLSEQIEEAATPTAKLHAIEAALSRRVLRAPVRHPAVDYALRRFAQIPQVETLNRVTDRLALSPRRFIEVFTNQTGLTPKLFCRVLRFQAAIQQANTGAPLNWSAVAADCGYFDQSHFIHDFKAFTGLSPSQYAQLRGPHLNHVPLG